MQFILAFFFFFFFLVQQLPSGPLGFPCACLPKTSASPGPPQGGGQPNVTWTLYRAAADGRGWAVHGVDERRNGSEVRENETEVKEDFEFEGCGRRKRVSANND